MYTVMITLLQEVPNVEIMRIERRWPNTIWKIVWKNLWIAPVPESMKSAWYRVIHDIIPTR